MMVGVKMNRLPNPKSSGFTLVELLLAVSLMALLLSLAYGGLKAATRASTNGQVLLEESGKVRITHRFIRRQLNQMQPLPFDIADDLDETRIVFEGDSRRIQFVAPMPGYLGQGGPQVQYLELVNGENGLDLLFSHQLLQGYDPQYMIEREPILLMEGIQDARFEFIGLDEDGELTAWSSNWDTPGVLPKAVTLDMQLGEESRAIWPLLSTGVKVDELATQQTGGVQSYSEAIRNMIGESDEIEQ